MTDEIKNNELNEEQLEGVFGGVYRPDYKSGAAPLFHKGDKVVIHRCIRDWGVKKYIKYRATVWKVSEKPYIDGQFMYCIIDEDGNHESSIHESDMLERADDGSWVPNQL